MQVGKDEDSKYTTSDAEGGKGEGGGELEAQWELTEGEGEEEEGGEEAGEDEQGYEYEDWYGMVEEGEVEEVEEGDGSGEVIIEIDNDIGEEIAGGWGGGSSDEPPQMDWHYDKNRSSMGNPRNETTETEPQEPNLSTPRTVRWNSNLPKASLSDGGLSATSLQA